LGKVNTLLHAFNRGEVSRFALARVDSDRLRLSAETQINWAPQVLGPMMLRPGMEYIASTKSDAEATLLEFIFAKDDTALLELTAMVMRVHVDDELVTRGSVSTAVQNGDFGSPTGWTLAATSGASTTLSGGLNLEATPRGSLCTATQALTIGASDQGDEHALRIVVARGPVVFRVGSTSGGDDLLARTVLDTGTHSLTFTPLGANAYIQFESTDRQKKIVTSIQIEASGTMELPTPFASGDLRYIRYDQSGDIIFLACPGVKQRKIERRSTRSWSVVHYDSDDGPFQPSASANLKLTPSVYEGNGTLSSDRPFFKSTHVGSLIRLFSTGQVNQAVLGAADVYSEPIRIAGAGVADRKFNWIVSGTWAGTITLQRSVDGEDRGFVDIASTTINATTAQDDTSTHNNIIAWYRIGFKPAAYTSGSATVSFGAVGVGTGNAASAGGRAGIARITSFASETSVEIEVLAPFSSLVPTSDWQESDWSDRYGWPSSVAFHDGRLFWAGRDRLWGSVSDNFYSFDLDVEGDSGPINRSIGRGPVEIINWLLPLARLIAGREMSEVSVRSSSFDEPLTPTGITFKDCSTQGSAPVKPGKIDKRGVFVQQSNRKVYQLIYDVEAQDYSANDLTRLNPDIGIPGFRDLAIQRQPDTQVHLVLENGNAAVLLFEPQDEVMCWWRVDTDGDIEAVAVLPGDLEDSVYYVVKRTINGSTKRFIEKMARRDQCSGQPEARCADSFVYYSGSSVTTITGLDHLEGETVVVWGWNTVTPFTVTMPDGSTKTVGRDLGTFTVSGGQITGLASAVTNAIVGLSYEADFVSAKLAYGAQLGTAVNQKKRIDHIGLVMFDTHYQGLRYGQDEDHLDDLPAVEDGAATEAHTVWEDFDKPMFPVNGDWDTDSRLYLKAAAPRPCIVAACGIGVETHERA
jgi:hypothetical protein